MIAIFVKSNCSWSLVMDVSELKNTLVVKNESNNLFLLTSVQNVNEWKE